MTWHNKSFLFNLQNKHWRRYPICIGLHVFVLVKRVLVCAQNSSFVPIFVFKLFLPLLNFLSLHLRAFFLLLLSLLFLPVLISQFLSPYHHFPLLLQILKLGQGIDTCWYRLISVFMVCLSIFLANYSYQNDTLSYDSNSVSNSA